MALSFPSAGDERPPAVVVAVRGGAPLVRPLGLGVGRLVQGLEQIANG